MSSSPSEEWSEGTWVEALPKHPLFKALREDQDEVDGGERREKLLLCECRGDLFAWSPAMKCLLTTNLKRLHARRDEASVFQRLHPSVVPVHQPVTLLPSPSGQHLALVGETYVSVLELRRHRGPGGEFAGGALETDCLAMPVASTLLRAHTLTIHHASWHPEQLDTLLLLTSDGVLRLFSLTHPEVPHLSVSVLPTAQTPQTLRLEEEGSVVACAVVGECALLLLERVDVLVVGLHVGAQPSPPLPMHPATEDSYSVGGCDMLVLSSSPPVVVMATDSGRVLHCVYISGEERPHEEGMLFVVETVCLPDVDGVQTDTLRLLQDPHTRHGYCVMSSAGLFHVTLPWVTTLEQWSSEVLGFAPVPSCVVEQVVSCPEDSVMDAALVCDPMLGSAALLLFSDGNCLTEELTQEAMVPQGVSMLGPADPQSMLQVVPSSEDFYRHIHAVLHPSTECSPVRRLGKETTTQQHCLDFLQHSSLVLRNRYLTPQVEARAELVGRVDILARRKERQMAELVVLEEQSRELQEMGQTLALRLEQSKLAANALTERVEKILCSISTSSPVLSDAEEGMAREMRSNEQQLKTLQLLIDKARAKVEVGLSAGESREHKLSSSNMATVLSALEEDGKRAREAVEMVQQMSTAIHSATHT